ncbi:type 1 glutamine amidotransferase domain-containing protein [Phaeobacter sp. B1627]|uniref:type 1 glutamine amidotransferase domain-containing protein n=1 Tax=Phaeobacter sp. B1627 TaxID=2583809 RepID=UPI001118C92D|nr:type 1 glutamine amidotransferase domain-containing protein [Phaeobacter sp. B1627]TNJ47542.1 type 1 glutamine amidotransferase [Phaeobacter sp. B1627]
MPTIGNAKILIISTHGFEQSELEVPRDQLREAGATVHVATLHGKSIRGWDNNNWGGEVEADLKVADVNTAEYDALVIPGGQINPDLLRVERDVISRVKEFHNQGKVIAAVCHAPWVLVEAGIVEGREVTSYHSVKTDMINAGGKWTDAAVVADAGIVTSRQPDDLDAFVAKIIEEIEEGAHERKAA